jgi:thiazole synthase
MWTLADKILKSRLFLGSARYPSPEILRQSIVASGSEVVTVSLRRESAQQNSGNRFWDYLRQTGVHILPNTAGCLSVREAILTAHMSRELFQTHWIKLEVIGNDDTLQPDPFGTVEAARILCAEGFEVFPYTTDDLVVAEKLVSVGCRIIMPWGSPIGTGQGLRNLEALKTLRQRLPGIMPPKPWNWVLMPCSSTPLWPLPMIPCAWRKVLQRLSKPGDGATRPA